MDTFLKYWFTGLESGLSKIDTYERSRLLKECAAACSHSYSLARFQEAYHDSEDLKGFLENLKKSFKELHCTISSDGKTISFIYDHCACDLYRRGFIKSGFLCDCSKHSLQYNLESVMGAGSAEVTLKRSILQGHDSCILEVKLE